MTATGKDGVFEQPVCDDDDEGVLTSYFSSRVRRQVTVKVLNRKRYQRSKSEIPNTQNMHTIDSVITIPVVCPFLLPYNTICVKDIPHFHRVPPCIVVP